MTRINKMVMHGFKSFAQRTELVFGEGFNCVLGPNGSGKSNILDALCFVLGRLGSKSLRAEKSGNLVYNGGKTRKPMKQGEVSIFFDNKEKTFPTEDPFVKLTRIIKKDGQSVYKINDQKRTRQQIIDLMSVARIDPSGHNIILQGDIVRFTEMPTEERRTIIEEISGISVYEDKKQKALKELDKVQERLKEAGIVLAERQTHLKELEKDRDQALKFKDIESKVKQNKASYIFLQIEKKQESKNKLVEKINSKKAEISSINENINGIKESIKQKREEIENINREIEDKAEKEQVNLQRDIEKLKIDLATNKQRKDHVKNEIEKIDLRKKQLAQNLEELEQEIKSLGVRRQEIVNDRTSKLAELNKIQSRINEFKQDNSIEDAAEIEKQIDESDKSIEKNQQEVDNLRKHQQDLVRKKDGIEYQIANIDDQINKVIQIEKEHANEIANLKNKKDEFKKSISELNERLESDSKFAVSISNEKDKLRKAQEQLSKLEARSAGIKENISGNAAVKNILQNKKAGVYGTIAELGTVSQDYSLALEIAAGPRLNSIVVENDKTAADCINYLKQNKLGTATFLPLNKIKSKDVDNSVRSLIGKEGVVGLAVDLVSFESKFEKAFSYVFGSTLIVDDLNTARRLGIGSSRMVTLDGDLAEVSGAMQGGYRQKQRFAFKEKEVLTDINKYESLVIELEKEVERLEDDRASNEEWIDRLRETRANLEGEIIKTEKGLHIDSGDMDASKQKKETLKNELKTVQDSIEKIEENIDNMIKELTDAKIKKQQLREKVNSIRNPSLMAELNAFEERRTAMKDEIMQIENSIKSIETEIKDIKEPEKERIADILKGHAKEQEDFNHEITKLSELIIAVSKNLEAHEKKAQEFYAKNKEMIARKTKLGDEIESEDSKIEGLRESSKQIEIGMNELSLKNAEVSAKLAGLREEFAEYEGVPINKEKSEEELKKEIDEFEKMMIQIGNVNMRALEIYEGIEKEYNSLLAKKESLVSEKEDVIGMMDEIEGRKKELFMKSYDIVNENFQTIFSEIASKKGEASLELENPENPFEAGLNIKVRVAGRKFLDIRSLSGGEKTMTALAFIFAIQECDPHSFYILDEVDAALDKHNSEKLAKLVRKYVDKAQYIVISHNDAVISEADTLYGVSMNEHSISNVTSLKI